MTTWRMHTNIPVSVGTARKYLRHLVSIYFMSSLSRIIMKKLRRMMPKMPCLFLIFGVFSTRESNILNDDGSDKKLAFCQMIWCAKWMLKERLKIIVNNNVYNLLLFQVRKCSRLNTSIWTQLSTLYSNM